MFLSEWHEFPSAPCLAEKKKILMTARVSMLKPRASLTCFRACFLRGRTKDFSAPRYYQNCKIKECEMGGQVARMGQMRNSHRIFVAAYGSWILFGRRRRLEYNIKIGLK